MKDKFNVAFLGTDSHAGTINDMFQDALPHHPRIEHVDWEWVSPRFGKDILESIGLRYILDRIDQYDLIFENPYIIKAVPEIEALFDKFNLWKKIIVYDINDDDSMHFPRYQEKCLLYLKRAYRGNLMPQNRENIIPIDFPLFQMYLDVVPMNQYPIRDIAILCTLPQQRNGTPRSKAVFAVKDADWPPVNDWIQQIALFYSSGWVLSSAATCYRGVMNPPAPYINWWYVYMHMLRRAKILFNAANHTAIGDHRTWESFASGALVVTDRIPGSCPNPPLPDKHYLQLNIENPKETTDKAFELLKNSEERERIAKAGLEYAIEWHSSKARISYVMEEVIKRM